MTDDDRTVIPPTAEEVFRNQWQGEFDPLQPPHPDIRRSVSGGGVTTGAEAAANWQRWEAFACDGHKCDCHSTICYDCGCITPDEQEVAASQPSPRGPYYTRPADPRFAELVRDTSNDPHLVVEAEKLLSAAPEPSPSLDVERLRQAINATITDHDEDVEAIAAEYARLAQEPEGT